MDIRVFNEIKQDLVKIAWVKYVWFSFFGCFWKKIFVFVDTENDLKIHVFLADVDSRFKDPALVICEKVG